MSSVQDLKERLMRHQQRVLAQASVDSVSADGAAKTPFERLLALLGPVSELEMPPLLSPCGTRLDCNGEERATHVRAADFVSRWAKRTRDADTPDEQSAGAGVVRRVPLARGLVDIESKYLPPNDGQTLGTGVYGSVYKGVEKGSSQEYALKELRQQWIAESAVGFPPYLLREIDILLRAKHPNIVHGIEVGRPRAADSLFVVTNYAGTTLRRFLFSPDAYIHLSTRNTHPEAPRALTAKVKCIAKQLLCGLSFLHSNCICHRDLKTANVLIGKEGIVRICDFGLARFFQEGVPMTQGTVTLLYRAPELHFGLPAYSTKVDIWSAACIIAELLLKVQLFPAEPEAQHFCSICAILGLPDERTNFPGYLQLPFAAQMMRNLRRYNRGSRLRLVFERSNYRGARECVSDAFFDLMQSMLSWNPKDRPSAEELLNHRWFTEDPQPCDPAKLFTPLPHSLDKPLGGVPAGHIAGHDAAVTAEEQCEATDEKDALSSASGGEAGERLHSLIKQYAENDQEKLTKVPE